MAPKRALFVAVGDGGAPPPPLPPEKRQRAGPAPSRNSPELPLPPSPKHFLAIALVVLFLKRPCVPSLCLPLPPPPSLPL